MPTTARAAGRCDRCPVGGGGGRRPARRDPDRGEGPGGRQPGSARPGVLHTWPTRRSSITTRPRSPGCKRGRLCRYRQDQHPRVRVRGRHLQPDVRCDEEPLEHRPLARRFVGRHLAAVAGGLVPLATGSDGGGSIRIPSALCGMSGFKPSQGRIPHGSGPDGRRRSVDRRTDGPSDPRCRARPRRRRRPEPRTICARMPHPGPSRSGPHVTIRPTAPARLLYCPSGRWFGPSTPRSEAVTEAAVGSGARGAGVEVVEIGPGPS